MTRHLDLLAERSAAEVVVAEPACDHSVRAVRALGGLLLPDLAATGKPLVQLVVDASVDAVGAYLECLRRGYAVLVVDARLGDARQRAVRDAFAPDAIIDTRRTAPAAPLAGPAYRLAATHGRTAVLVRRQAVPGRVPDAVAVLLATSGSLGMFRFVCLSYAALAANARAIAQTLSLTGDDRAATTLSPAYSYGLSVLNSHLLAGGSVAILHTAPTARDFWPRWDGTRCTTLAGVPETYRLLVAGGVDLAARPTLRLATLAGARMPESLVIRVATALAGAGKEFAMMYGQTEATARISVHRGADVLRWPGSVGRVIPGGRLWIDPGGGEPRPGVAAGDGAGDGAGEILFAGPSIMLGYARDRAELSAVPDEPPAVLRTGDLGYLSGDRLHVAGRLARRAKPLGVRVQLDEVETAFAATGPAAVVAEADDTLTVYVEGPLAPHRAVYREVLAAYLLPPAAVRMVSVPALPRTVSGKVAYRELATVAGRAAEPRGDADAG